MKKLTGYNYKYLKKNAQWFFKLGFAPLIVSAGMHRSGSTLLFNILREILAFKYEKQLSCGWYGEFQKIPKGKAYLVKAHSLTFLLNQRSEYIFYSYRDVRTAAVSANKVFNVPINIQEIRNSITEYQVAKKNANLIIKYEKLVNNTIDVISEICKITDIKCEIHNIYMKCMNIDKPKGSFMSGYVNETLYHPGHITNTSNDEWRGKMSNELQKQISDEFGWWFNECGYPLE